MTVDAGVGGGHWDANTVFSVVDLTANNFEKCIYCEENVLILVTVLTVKKCGTVHLEDQLSDSRDSLCL